MAGIEFVDAKRRRWQFYFLPDATTSFETGYLDPLQFHAFMSVEFIDMEGRRWMGFGRSDSIVQAVALAQKGLEQICADWGVEQ